MIPRSQVQHISGFWSRACNNDDDFTTLLEDTPEQSPIDELLPLFQTKGLVHCVLYHHVTQQSRDVTREGEFPSYTIDHVDMHPSTARKVVCWDSLGDDGDKNIHHP